VGQLFSPSLQRSSSLPPPLLRQQGQVYEAITRGYEEFIQTFDVAADAGKAVASLHSRLAALTQRMDDPHVRREGRLQIVVARFVALLLLLLLCNPLSECKEGPDGRPRYFGCAGIGALTCDPGGHAHQRAHQHYVCPSRGVFRGVSTTNLEALTR